MRAPPAPDEYRVEPMTPAAARAIADWHYPGQYAFYDLDADPGDRAEFLDPATWPGHLFAVYDRDGDHGGDGRDGSGPAGFYEFTAVGDAVEVGLGLAPDRTGEGRGEGFVRAALAFARERYDVSRVDLAVAVFNERAVTVYRRCGFVETGTEVREFDGERYEFVLMSRAL